MIERLTPFSLWRLLTEITFRVLWARSNPVNLLLSHNLNSWGVAGEVRVRNGLLSKVNQNGEISWAVNVLNYHDKLLQTYSRGAWINSWVNNREAGDLRCNRAHYDAIVMFQAKLWQIYVKFLSIFQAKFSDWWLRFLLLNFPHMNVTGWSTRAITGTSVDLTHTSILLNIVLQQKNSFV